MCVCVCTCIIYVHIVCTTDERVCYILSSGERPTLPELLRLQVPERVGVSYFKFGIFLLNDETGDRVCAFKKECKDDAEDVTMKILQEWLRGRGLAVMWETLVNTLRDTKLSSLADEIATYLKS